MKEKNGEHPFGDIGQLILLCLFLVVWITDSFFLHKSTFLSEHFPLYIRLVILALSFIAAVYLFNIFGPVLNWLGKDSVINLLLTMFFSVAIIEPIAFILKNIVCEK